MKLLDIWGLWSTNHLYICKSQGHSGPMKLKSHVYSRISYLFRALEARIYWIIANLLDDCKSLGWLQISGMIANLLDIQGLWSTNLMYIFESPRRLGPIGRESQGYLGPMKHKSPVYLRNSGILGAMITCILANLLDICKSHRYSGPKGAPIS